MTKVEWEAQWSLPFLGERHLALAAWAEGRGKAMQEICHETWEETYYSLARDLADWFRRKRGVEIGDPPPFADFYYCAAAEGGGSEMNHEALREWVWSTLQDAPSAFTAVEVLAQPVDYGRSAAVALKMTAPLMERVNSKAFMELGANDGDLRKRARILTVYYGRQLGFDVRK